jgi:hypothetical protein
MVKYHEDNSVPSALSAVYELNRLTARNGVCVVKPHRREVRGSADASLFDSTQKIIKSTAF